MQKDLFGLRFKAWSTETSAANSARRSATLRRSIARINTVLHERVRLVSADRSRAES